MLGFGSIIWCTSKEITIGERTRMVPSSISLEIFAKAGDGWLENTLNLLLCCWKSQFLKKLLEYIDPQVKAATANQQQFCCRQERTRHRSSFKIKLLKKMHHKICTFAFSLHPRTTSKGTLVRFLYVEVQGKSVIAVIGVEPAVNYSFV